MEYKEPTQAKTDKIFIDLHMKYGSCAVTSDHEVYCWAKQLWLSRWPSAQGDPMWKLEMAAGKLIKVASSSGANCVLKLAKSNAMATALDWDE